MSSSRWGTRTKRTVALIGLALIGLLLTQVLDILPLVIVSMLLAYLLLPIALFYERRLLSHVPWLRSRTLAVLLTFITVIAFFVVLALVIVPVFFSQIQQMAESFPRFLRSVEGELNRILSEPLLLNGEPLIVDGRVFIPLEQLQSVLGERPVESLIQAENVDVLGTVSAFLGSVGGLTGSAFGVLGGFFNTVVNISFLLLLVFYMMRDGEKFAGHLVHLTPEAYRGDVRRLLYELGQVWNAYLRGQIILSVTVGFMVFIAATVLGLPNAPLLGLLSALFEFIPNLGPTLAVIPAFTLAVLNQSSTLPFLEGLPYGIIVAVIWAAIQNIESFFLVPRVMGGSLDLHPVAVIIAVIAGASIAGALGLVLAAPFLATGRLFGQYIYGKLFDIDPFPVSQTHHPPRQPITPRDALRRARTLALRLVAWLPPSLRQRLPHALRLSSPPDPATRAHDERSSELNRPSTSESEALL